ncbi:MAG: DUF4062 domain-containing protein [Anaerolineae bacterium]|nr:DUF4062 domain-containing protein [Anaerolineae bacterium]
MAKYIYFGDTSSELQRLRPVLIDQIRQMGLTPVWLSDDEKQRPDMRDIVQRKISDCDAFISLVTFLRGWEPQGMGGQSLAEIEFNIMQSLGKTSAILLPSSDGEMAKDLRMRSLLQPPPDMIAQKRFWDALERSATLYYYDDETDLTRQLTAILTTWARQNSGSAQSAETVKRDGDQTFFPTNGISVDVLAERVAEKTAARVQAMQQQQQEELAKQTLKYNEALRLQPGELVFGRPATGSQFKSDIFMIMPFAASFNPIYHDVVRPVCLELLLTVIRGDEFTSTQGSVIEEVWAALNNCKFVIAEITGGNDNVYYELGVAHTLNKPAILITQAQKPEDVPFDIRHLRYITYENSEAGRARLRDQLKEAITRLRADLQEGWGASA